MQKSFHYIVFNKPYGVLSQFSQDANHPVLSGYDFPKDVYPVGRLDVESEGLMILTDDGWFQHYLIEAKYGHARTYHVQIERIPDASALEKLRTGIVIEGQKTKPATVSLIEPSYPERDKPIRFRKNIPTCWLEISLTEGRNRQVRKMTAAVGHPALRLIRTQILFLNLNGLESGKWRELTSEEIRRFKSAIKS